MALPKGVSGNPNGRPKGAIGKNTIATKEALSTVVNNYLNGIGDFYLGSDLAEMDSVDRSKVIASFLPYILPKQSVVGVGIDESIKEKLSSLFPFEEPDDQQSI